MIQTSCAVVDQRELTENYYLIKIEAPQIVAQAIPGQFVMLQAWEYGIPLLRRPFSFHRLSPESGTFELLYVKVGKGTEIMSRLGPGDRITVLGPAGNGITWPENPKRIAVVGRGIGVAPMLAILDEAERREIESYAYLSARNGNMLLRKDEMEKKAIMVRVTTDDASEGISGNVTSFLEQDLSKMKFDAVYTCGSRRLKRHVEELKNRHGFAAWVLLEQLMACGRGECKGCAVRMKDYEGRSGDYGKYALVCKDGPVFPVEEVAD
jgi:dihydroorotate dehydrogenase electron transfer subunit